MEVSFSMPRLFQFEGLCIEYACTSENADLESIVCLHGFGRSLYDFELFFPLLAPHQRLVGIHIIGHHNSTMHQLEPLSAGDWSRCMGAFLDHLNIGKAHLLAYSMGARLAMMMGAHLPDRLHSLLLLAPDGLKKNALYMFASKTVVGRWLSNYIVHRPKWLFNTADVLKALRLLSPKLHRFVYVHMDTLEKRKQVHDVWLVHRELFPHLPSLHSTLLHHHVSIHMVFGEYDEVIPLRLGKKCERLWNHYGCVHSLPCGHRLLRAELLVLLRERQLWPH